MLVDTSSCGAIYNNTMKYRFRHSRTGFTLVELLIGISVFTLGITSVFLLLQHTMKSVVISRNEVIVANLLREQIELVRNIRDSNLLQLASWNNSIGTGTFFVENDFTATGVTYTGDGVIGNSPVSLSAVTLDTTSTPAEKFETARLCFDEQKRYVHCIDDAHKTASGSAFASYIMISEMEYDQDGTMTGVVADETSHGLILDARVITREGNNYREYDAKTAITDWIR